MTLLDRPRMSWLIQSGVFAVIAAMCGYFAAVELQPAFGLASSQQVKDFGVVRTGEICKAIFDIRNVGSAPVEIMEVIKGCVDGGRKRRRGDRVAAVQNGGAQPCSSLRGDDRGDSPDHTLFQREAQECTATWRFGARYDVRC